MRASRWIFAVVLFIGGILKYSHLFADELVKPSQSSVQEQIEKLENDLRVESTCVELKAKRGSNSRETKLFELLGCCYNDGLEEAKGC